MVSEVVTRERLCAREDYVTDEGGRRTPRERVMILVDERKAVRRREHFHLRDIFMPPCLGVRRLFIELHISFLRTCISSTTCTLVALFLRRKKYPTRKFISMGVQVVSILFMHERPVFIKWMKWIFDWRIVTRLIRQNR